MRNRPDSSEWKQQKIYACRPIYTAHVVISTVTFVGFVFIPLGYVCLIASNSVKEWRFDYTNCSRLGSTCEINVNLQEDFMGDVYFYYGLSNFYQNARRYLRSVNFEQLKGDLGCTTHCSDPYKIRVVNLTRSQCGGDYILSVDDECVGTYWTGGKCYKPIAPCGAIANSFFTDSFKLKDSNGQDVPWTYKGLLSESIRTKFSNPTPLPGDLNLCDTFNKRSAKPRRWKKAPCELDPENPTNNGFENFDFMIWMQPAAFSTFKKLYRKLIREGAYTDGLRKGFYKLIIENDYNVSIFNGKKYFIITTTSWLGSKNRFFGIVFLCVGFLCLIMSIILCIIHRRSGHSLDDIAQIPKYE